MRGAQPGRVSHAFGVVVVGAAPEARRWASAAQQGTPRPRAAAPSPARPPPAPVSVRSSDAHQAFAYILPTSSTIRATSQRRNVRERGAVVRGYPRRAAQAQTPCFRGARVATAATVSRIPGRRSLTATSFLSILALYTTPSDPAATASVDLTPRRCARERPRGGAGGARRGARGRGGGGAGRGAAHGADDFALDHFVWDVCADDAARLARREGIEVVLQTRERDRELRADEVRARGERLTELVVRRAQRPEHVCDELRAACGARAA